MNTNVDVDVKALSAKSLLLDWTSGQGATGKNPENFEHADNVLHDEIISVLNTDISISLAQALIEQKFAGALPSMLEAWKNGYISPNHASQHKTGNITTKSNATFVSSKAILTSEQYLTNCIKLGLDTKNTADILDIVEGFYALTDKSTKADLHFLLARVVHIFCSQEQYEVYTTKLSNEEAATRKFSNLTSAGFIDIRSMPNGRYVANLPRTNLRAIGILSDNSFSLVGTQSINDTLHQVTFKDSSAEE
jgi:hypothetical protein